MTDETISADQHRMIMLQNEGQLISCAGHASLATACAFARAEIDGKVNAMIRLQGAQKTAEYLFAAADRVHATEAGRADVMTGIGYL
jgi:hypothetical protein